MLTELRRIWIRPVLVAFVIIVADQVTKALIWARLGPVEGASVPLLGDWLRFTLVKNTGVAFGMFQNMPEFFTVTSVVISLGALYFYWRYLPNGWLPVQICMGLIIGGAVGNIIDRVRFNYVIDFVHVTWFPGIFNVADSAITIGVITLTVLLLFEGDRPVGARHNALLSDLVQHDRWRGEQPVTPDER